MIEKLLRLPDVMDMTGKSRSAIYMDMAANPPQFLFDVNEHVW